MHLPHNEVENLQFGVKNEAPQRGKLEKDVRPVHPEARVLRTDVQTQRLYGGAHGGREKVSNIVPRKMGRPDNGNPVGRQGGNMVLPTRSGVNRHAHATFRLSSAELEDTLDKEAIFVFPSVSVDHISNDESKPKTTDGDEATKRHIKDRRGMRLTGAKCIKQQSEGGANGDIPSSVEMKNSQGRGRERKKCPVDFEGVQRW
ncbi:hypothetical protein OF83DRAFT_1084752 [Amylostereum chailletii]|nr:hypothetical protein OF83DRAFT_1084752 [Amylostereum chailletii]